MHIHTYVTHIQGGRRAMFTCTWLNSINDTLPLLLLQVSGTSAEHISTRKHACESHGGEVGGGDYTAVACKGVRG